MENQAIQELLSAALQLILIIGVGLLTSIINQARIYLTQKFGQQKFYRLENFAGTVVQAVEQMIGKEVIDDTAEVAKGQAMLMLRSFASKIGYNVSDEVLSALIESALKAGVHQYEKVVLSPLVEYNVLETSTKDSNVEVPKP